MTPIIAIVGGGISGTLTVLQLIKHSKKPLSVLWFDTQSKFCKGYAYSTFDAQHLLNVRANNMSVYVDEPNHFTDWLIQFHPHYTAKDFVPRKIFGEYVLHTFENLKYSNPQVSISQIAEEVKSISKKNDEFELITYTSYIAQKLILAFGNFLPAHPKSISTDFISSKNYFQNAFNVQLTQNIATCKHITIIGSGLTMIDVIISIAQYNYKGTIHVISPHGYIPQAHQENPLPPVNSFIEKDKTYSLLEIFSIVNKQLKKAKKENMSLHSVIDVMRPFLQDIWFNFTLSDKQQFLRHLRHKWGVARHRAPKQSLTIFEHFHQINQVFLTKGRVFDIKTIKNGFHLFYTNPQNKTESLNTELLINCTGPQSNYATLKSPLVQALIKDGIIAPDPINYGLNAQKDGVLGENIFTIGPPLKGILWESVAVPEIRLQAQKLAAKII